MVTDLQYIKQLCKEKGIQPKTIVPFIGTFKDIADNVNLSQVYFFGDMNMDLHVLGVKYPAVMIWQDGTVPDTADWTDYQTFVGTLKGEVILATFSDSGSALTKFYPNVLFDNIGFMKSGELIEQGVGSFAVSSSVNINTFTDDNNGIPLSHFLQGSNLNKKSNQATDNSGLYLDWVNTDYPNSYFNPPILQFIGFKITC